MLHMVRIGAFCCGVLLLTLAPATGDDTELRDIDITGWQCLNRPTGTAKTPDGGERNTMKNRAPVSLDGRKVEALDTAAFLKKVASCDAVLKAQRRNQLTGVQKAQLTDYEDQLVSITGYLVLAYPGPPETTNCGDKHFHDWHLELFEQPSDHHPQPGDPTPIICEVTPRTEQLVYRDGIRLQALAAFFREQKQYVPTGHPAQLVKVTGYLMWDDEHNGKADVGTTVQYITAGNGFHHPWRSTAWEIHPVIRIEPIGGAHGEPGASVPAVAAVPTTTAPGQSATQSQGPEFVTITRPVNITIPFGQTTLQPGIRLRVIGRDATTVRVDYMGRVYTLPADAVR